MSLQPNSGGIAQSSRRRVPTAGSEESGLKRKQQMPLRMWLRLRSGDRTPRRMAQILRLTRSAPVAEVVSKLLLLLTAALLPHQLSSTVANRRWLTQDTPSPENLSTETEEVDAEAWTHSGLPGALNLLLL